MSCPDWPSLVAARGARGDDPPGWREGLEHLQACPGCRRRAVAADPTLVFQRLPRREASRTDVEGMKQAVAALRSARRLGAPAPARSLRSVGGRWAVAAAALLVALASLGPGEPSRPGVETGEIPPAPVFTAAAGEVVTPYVEDLDLPDPRVYQFAEDELVVVMIVDSSLDIPEASLDL